MKFKSKLPRLFIFGSIALFLMIPLGVYAGESIGNWFIIAGDGEQEVSPAIAYNSQREQYLVVWYNNRAGNDDIRAQRLSEYGSPLGGPFYISAGSGADRRFPDVAYNSVQDQYLVVWEHEEAANGKSIKGRRISGTGQVLDANDITIQGPGYNLYTPTKPVVSYASKSDRYLVVWAETWHPMPITYDIYGQVINHLGNLEGGKFSISSGSDLREEPDVAYNRHANRYLVVWQQDSGAVQDIHGQQVHGGGGVYQGNIIIAQYTVTNRNPTIAAIPTTPSNTKFLVVWEIEYSPNNWDIISRTVAEDGSLGNFNYISSDPTVDESTPVVSGDESAQQYLVAWRHPQGVVDKPIIARVVSNVGAPQDSVAEFSGVDADFPAIASGPFGDFLLAWHDQPVFATNTDIYGQLWGNRFYMPQVIGVP